MVKILNPDNLVKIVRKDELDKSDLSLLIDELIRRIDSLELMCRDSLPPSQDIKDVTRLTRSIDRFHFTIDNCRYLDQYQKYKQNKQKEEEEL